MKNNTINSILLILLLSYYGQQLTRNMFALRARVQSQHTTAAKNEFIVFRDANGTDIYGKSFLSSTAPGTVQIAFLLRDETLSEDLAFWYNVSRSLLGAKAYELVGFCDGDACSKRAAQDSRARAFRIIQYGEVVSAQALANADVKDSCILSPTSRSRESNLRWRNTNATPASIMEEVAKFQ